MKEVSSKSSNAQDHNMQIDLRYQIDPSSISSTVHSEQTRLKLEDKFLLS